jgi:hypothetical protein
MVDSNDLCLICLTNPPVNPRKCEGCSKLFCTICILQWKILKNQCPYRCGETWKIDLDDIDEFNSNGFIVCPLDKKIGSFICSTCKNQKEFISFRIEYITDLKCPFCKKFVDFYHSYKNDVHKECMNEKRMYFFCNSCKKRYCPCLSKIK